MATAKAAKKSAPAAAAPTGPQSVKLKLTKSTPGTHVYGTDVEGVICKQVYLAKSGLPDPAPETITLTVEF